MVNKIIAISDDIYPIDDVIKDLENLRDKLEDIVFVTFLKDGTATVSHTGLNFKNMALACKLMDAEFNAMVITEVSDNQE